MKFADKKRHQIYLEPEGIDTDEIYANGLPTSLPSDVQLEFVHTIQGLENAEVAKFGYAIEYDCMPPTQLKQTLETKTIENLFLAGQVNCTSGYEEAAAQGIYAAFNSICKFKAKEPFILDRSEAYIAVLIDDLITKGTNEPYRMFTSRAEFRLLLRQDNADERLMKYGYEFGLIKKEIYEKMLENKSKAEKLIEDLKSIKSENISLDKWLKRPEMTIESIPSGNLDFNVYSNDILRKVEWDMKYEGYIKRQEMEVSKFKKLEKRKLPEDIDYSKIKGLRREAREKLTGIRPASIGHAARIPGMTNCDISLILVYCKKSL